MGQENREGGRFRSCDQKAGHCCSAYFNFGLTASEIHSARARSALARAWLLEQAIAFDFLLRLKSEQAAPDKNLHDADLKQYIFVFSGSGGMPCRDAAMSLVYGCMELLDRLASDEKPQDRPSESLTRREIECLRWSAAGKSSDEIAIILDLSSHTVVGYLKSAMRKLDSVNRMQAVARAFR
ncbi:helix-turn-helix transcriptional regulator, partial [Rhizobium sp. BK377]|uniref:helix-turn-helix domain-containing protein n=1 Tax=Rhizobium sp. BK377 TaxID=2587058 RepID=UPI0017FAC755